MISKFRSVYNSAKLLLLRKRINAKEQIDRFQAIYQQYEQICRKLENNSHQTKSFKYTPSGYDWDTFRNSVRQGFAKGVPVNFLSHPVVKNTMVFSGSNATKLVDYVCDVFSIQDGSSLLLEDYIGLPQIIDVRTRTSPNRAL